MIMKENDNINYNDDNENYNDVKTELDFRTDYGRGLVYKSVDGSEHESMAAVRQANKEYWDGVKFGFSSEDRVRYEQLEKAYFDMITPKIININDKDAEQQFLTAQMEKMAAYIQERYGSYLEQFLAQRSYGQEDINKKSRR